MAAGVLVFVVDSMARATYALAVSFVAVGAALLLVRLDYVGVVTILMMIMEMAVMAVYMVMFMGMNPALMPMSMVHSHRAAVGVSAAVFVLLAVGDAAGARGRPPGAPRADPTADLGMALMGDNMLVMMGVSVVMVATIVAGLVLALHRGRYQRFGDDLSLRPTDPQRGGVGR